MMLERRINPIWHDGDWGAIKDGRVVVLLVRDPHSPKQSVMLCRWNADRWETIDGHQLYYPPSLWQQYAPDVYDYDEVLTPPASRA